MEKKMSTESSKKYCSYISFGPKKKNGIVLNKCHA